MSHCLWANHRHFPNYIPDCYLARGQHRLNFQAGQWFSYSSLRSFFTVLTRPLWDLLLCPPWSIKMPLKILRKASSRCSPVVWSYVIFILGTHASGSGPVADLVDEGVVYDVLFILECPFLSSSLAQAGSSQSSHACMTINFTFGCHYDNQMRSNGFNFEHLLSSMLTVLHSPG